MACKCIVHDFIHTTDVSEDVESTQKNEFQGEKIGYTNQQFSILRVAHFKQTHIHWLI